MTDTVRLDLRLVALTPAALGVTEDEPDDPVIWLPRSQVDLIRGNDEELGSVIVVDVPEWLALDKGLA